LVAFKTLLSISRILISAYAYNACNTPSARTILIPLPPLSGGGGNGPEGVTRTDDMIRRRSPGGGGGRRRGGSRRSLL
jgi:hypothetical protein